MMSNNRKQAPLNQEEIALLTRSCSQGNSRSLRIGITERGDAALDLSWTKKVENKEVDGAVIVTKRLSYSLRNAILALHKQGFQLAVHVCCTGWGGSWLEPRVPTPEEQIIAARTLIEAGFPANRCTLRIDPIVASDEGIERARHVLRLAAATPCQEDNTARSLLDVMQIRISIYDEYKHVKERLAALGRQPFYAGFQASDEQLLAVLAMLREQLADGRSVETCAEPRLVELDLQSAQQAGRAPLLREQGCISNATLELFGIEPEKQGINPQKRHGCHCLQCKTELLSRKAQCAHRCVYCYWQ